MHNRFSKILLGIPFAAVLALVVSAPVLAENSDATASDSMHSAGSSLKQAGADTADAVRHTYRGVKSAAEDAKATVKEKSALHDNKAGGDPDIHVSTEGGVVTLRGEWPSREVAMNAEQLAQQTEGVTRVNNELTVMAASNPH